MSDLRIFISYRRKDSALASRWLAELFDRAFGVGTAFIDTDAIRVGDDWSRTLEAALRGARVLVVVIGPTWLKAHDDQGRRRIDKPDDWVRQEIEYALRTERMHIFPLVVSGAELPAPDALPEAIARLTGRQAFVLRDAFWQADAEAVVAALETVGFRRRGDNEGFEYPIPRSKRAALTSEELTEALRRLPGWTEEKRPGDGTPVVTRHELVRLFDFDSFEDALHFMNAASRQVSKMKHHPDWRNLYRQVKVWLTTWDIGHRPSYLDVELAAYLNDLYATYVTPEKE